ncbi:MAG TPA: glutamine-hydrolyzing carbamoyl-phosphate synthase small subunit, partial [bacterium]|nr:glutamine-hydrolyzing carbamoyl-phosphate synthase small subunit [bacterium]
CGARGTAIGEVVFNTSMTGYQEIITDPSYAGQIITFTYPLIGNYGINVDDYEAENPATQGIVVKELAATPSNWRKAMTLEDYLLGHDKVGVCGVDTRSLTQHLRTRGAVMGGITTELSAADLLDRVRAHPGYEGHDLVKTVTRAHAVTELKPDSGADAGTIGLIDCGHKANILRMLLALGPYHVRVYPAEVPAAEIRNDRLKGLVVSNGPGDPAACMYIAETIAALVAELPLMGICLGHQLLALGLGGRTVKMKFGHRGANHPVQDLATGKVNMSSQNHGFVVDDTVLSGTGLRVSHRNLNDGTVEGLVHEGFPVFSVQYHPEAFPGPRENAYLFDQFFGSIEGAAVPVP